MKKKISWITPDYYIDVDLPIVDRLSQIFTIKWMIVISRNASIIDNKKFVEHGLTHKSNLLISFTKLECRSVSPTIWKSYYRIVVEAKTFNPDIYYISLYGMPHALLFYEFFLPKDKCVAACHNVTTPQGAKWEKIAKIYTSCWLTYFKNIQVFSKGQYNKLVSLYSGKNVLMAPLALKDYGEPKEMPDKLHTYPIRFLFFGNILEYKRVDLLIEAANKLVRKGYSNFKVRIAGACQEWEKYQDLIEHPEYFELYIRRIPNEDVAGLFADSHYFVMPYQDIAQSGAITVAFRYNLPTITSNIEQFKEFVTDNETGLTFESKNSDALATVMQYAIDHHVNIYRSLCDKQKEFVHRELSIESIVKKYVDYFNRL
ncbi:glycosyltransferase family 4 protein [Bacteroides gallinaceum]|uniref:glycosyltransferase family 4 protein n=1 Tax=Bacteroides gallinaceum TaxID=1462571 RepID=UPI0025AB4C0D|nr:glycosyltransferase family 4 protein [Bacteroides gallinaceum]MDN0077839.1 glycosyltransferase family 4 protein [Bacteroides gallinaceum]